MTASAHRRRGVVRASAKHQVTPELLTEQQFNIRLVVHHENEQVHRRSPGSATDAAERGNTILNSVNSPGCVSTSMEPACCLTMMS